MKLLKLRDVKIDEFEMKVDETVTRVWKWNKIFPTILLIILIALIPFPPFLLPFLFVLSLWLGSYLIRERWRLILTDKQIIGRQLFPRPFTFLTRDNHYPLNHIEGFSVGPRAYSTVLLLGLFFSTNIGVTLLKNGLLTRGVDLPDYLDAFILILRGMSFIPGMSSFADDFEEFSVETVSFIQKEVQVFLGMIFILIGVLIVLATIPRRDHLQIRVRQGADFKLNGGIDKKFWKNCYKELYKANFIELPTEFSDWDFPWLENEKVDGVADLVRTIYLNRVIGVLALYVGTLRIYFRVTSDEPFFSSSVIFWLIVAIVDIFIIIVGLRFSSEKNQLVISNQRIIFSHEVPRLSGSFGKRLFYMSDIRRNDVASFHFKKITRFSIPYLSGTIIMCLIFYFLYDRLNIFTQVIFVATIVGLIFFINQTYVEFQIRTKGGDIWVMRHQLSNPATKLRRLIGIESPFVNTIMTNRLEESEIIETVQLVRSHDLQLPRSKETIDVEERLSINQLLLPGEEVKITQNISRTVPNRKKVLITATLIFLFWMFSIFGSYEVISVSSNMSEDIAGILIFLSLVVGLYLIIILWVKYYSLFKSTLIITNHRIFLQHLKRPPRILFYFGILDELHVTEAVLSEVSSIYSSRDLKQLDYWRSSMGYFWKFILSAIFLGLVFGLFSSLLDNVESNSGLLSEKNLTLIAPIFLSIAFYFNLRMAWNASNSFVELIRGWPKRLLNVNGISFHYYLPFLNVGNANDIKDSIWRLQFGGRKN